MANENEFLLQALYMGVLITFVYDILRIFRRVVPHGIFLVSLEDICFWFYCAARVFLLMYHESNGTLRWFAVLGAMAGMLLYRRLVSPYFVKYVSLLLQKTCHVLVKTASFFLRPLVRLFRRIRERAARYATRLAVKRMKKRELARRRREDGSGKKKLTFFRKMFKMNL